MENKLTRKLTKVRKAIAELKAYYPNATIEIQPTETLYGKIVNHIYLRDRLSSGKVCLQKHIFTTDN